MKQYLEEVFGDQEGYVAVALKAADDWKERQFRWPDDRTALIRWAKAADGDVFVCPALREDDGGRKIDNPVSKLWWLWADVDWQKVPDDKHSLVRKRIDRLASLIVSSGTGDNCHVYVRLSRAVSIDEFAHLNQGLRDYLHADNKHPNNSLLRLPGTFNRKHAEPVRVRVVECNDGEVDPDKLLAQKTWQKVVATDTSSTVVDWEVADLSNLRKSLVWRIRRMSSDEAIARWGTRHGAVYAVVNDLVKAGATLDQIHAVMDDFPPAIEKANDERGYDVHRDIDRILGRVPPDTSLVPVTEDTFWTARPELAHIHAFARARRCSPWAVLGVVLVRSVGEIDPAVVLPPLIGKAVSLNLFIAVVGPSGSGKDSAVGVAEEAITDHCGVTTLNIGSGEAIAHAFVKREGGKVVPTDTRTVLFQVGEIDTFAKLTERKGATLMPELRKAYMGERLGFHYVDQAKRLPVDPHTYRMGLVAGVQPTRAGVLLNDADGGTPQRFLWLPAVDPEAPDHAPPAPDTWEWAPPRITHDPASYYHVPVCPQAVTEIDRARLATLKSEGHALDGHRLLAQLKVAAALAVLNQRLGVTDDDWRLARLVLKVSDDTRSGVVDAMAKQAAEAEQRRKRSEADRAAFVSERVEEGKVERVARYIVAKLEVKGSMSASAMRRLLQLRDRDHYEAALAMLRDQDLIVVERMEYQGQAGLRLSLPEQ